MSRPLPREGFFAPRGVAGKRLALGEIRDARMILNSAGEVVRAVRFDLPSRFPSVELREFVVMPNHVHVIVGLTWPIPRLHSSSTSSGGAASSALTIAFRRPNLGEVIRAFKSVSAIGLNPLLSRSDPVWQRNYFEQIVRNEKSIGKYRSTFTRIRAADCKTLRMSLNTCCRRRTLRPGIAVCYNLLSLLA